MNNKPQTKQLIWVMALKRIAFALILLAIALVYAGFYWPDPLAHRVIEAYYTAKMLWAARIGIPLVAIGVGALWLARKRGKIGRAQVVLATLTFLICSLLALHVFAFRYYGYLDRSRKDPRFHPYLQIVPNRYVVRPPTQKPPFRIMCLGGSTTAFLDSGKKRGWPERLEELLRPRYPAYNVEVHNVATPWYTSLHNLINYETNLRHYRPNMIIFMEAINDLLHNADFSYFSRGPFRDDYGHFMGPLNLVMGAVSFEHALFDSARAIWYAKPRAVVEQREFPGLSPYERNIGALIDLAEKDHVRFVLMTQPTLIKAKLSREEQEALYMVNNEAIGPGKMWSAATALSGMEQYNDRVRALAKARNLQLIDLEKQIPKTLEYFLDDVHYKDRSFDIIARYVAQELVRREQPIFATK